MLTQRVVVTRGETFTKQLGLNDATLTRDAIVKSLYEVRTDSRYLVASRGENPLVKKRTGRRRPKAFGDLKKCRFGAKLRHEDPPNAAETDCDIPLNLKCHDRLISTMTPPPPGVPATTLASAHSSNKDVFFSSAWPVL